MAKSLKLDWCSHEAAEYAVKRWHYSKTMPSGKLVKIGVWENDKYIGCIIYGLGANAHISNYNELKTAELCRVALGKHDNPVTKIVSISIRLLRKYCPDLQQIISYADLDMGHEGIIYKAGNWRYESTVKAKWKMVNGKLLHPRSIYAKYGTHNLQWLRENIDADAKAVETLGKKRFIYDLR